MSKIFYLSAWKNESNKEKGERYEKVDIEEMCCEKQRKKVNKSSKGAYN